MRVLIVTHAFGNVYANGIERVVSALAGELVHGGDEVTVVATYPLRLPAGRPVRPASPLAGVRVVHLDDPVLDVYTQPVNGPQSTRALEALVDDWRPDVVHITVFLGMDPGVVQRIQARGVPVVVSTYAYEPGCSRVWLQRDTGEVCAGPDGGRACAATCFAGTPDALERVTARANAFTAALRAADVLTAASANLARWLHDHCDAPAPLVLPPPLAPPGPICPDDMRATPATRGRLNLAMIAPIHPVKGPQVVVEALARAAAPPARLLLLGPVADPALAAALRQRAAGVPGLELKMVGAVEPAALSLLLGDVDAVLVASQGGAETYSLAAREAWSRGIPVLATRLGALPEAIREGDNGFTFPHDDPDALATILRRLVDEPELLPRLWAGSRRTSYLSASQHAAAVRAIYAELLADAVQRPSLVER